MTDRERMKKLSKCYCEYLNGQDMQPIDGYDDEFYDGVLWAYSRLAELYPDDDENEIDNAPTVDAIVNTIEVRPQGKWIDHSLENLLWGHNECPFCHKRSNRGASYCQYCGARLENSEE